MIDLEWRCFCCSCLTQWFHSVGHLYQSRLLLRRGAAWSHQMEFKIEHDSWWKLGVSNIVWKHLEHIFCFVGSYSLLIEIYILFHDCKWKFWALMFDSHFYWSHPPDSWLQNVTQKKYQLWLFHSAGGNPAVVRCEQTLWDLANVGIGVSPRETMNDEPMKSR